jgi:hypothetical protein
MTYHGMQNMKTGAILYNMYGFPLFESERGALSSLRRSIAYGYIDSKPEDWKPVKIRLEIEE